MGGGGERGRKQLKSQPHPARATPGETKTSPRPLSPEDAEPGNTEPATSLPNNRRARVWNGPHDYLRRPEAPESAGAPATRWAGDRWAAGPPGHPPGHPPGLLSGPSPTHARAPNARRPAARARGGHLCARGPERPPGRLGAAPMRAWARPRVLRVPDGGGAGRHTHRAVTSAGSEREPQLDARPRPPLRSSAVTTRPPARLPASRAGPTPRPERPGHSPSARPHLNERAHVPQATETTCPGTLDPQLKRQNPHATTREARAPQRRARAAMKDPTCLKEDPTCCN